MGYIWPVEPNTPITQYFGANPSNGVNPAGGHTGIDFLLPEGTPLRAPGDGVIDWADWVDDTWQDNLLWLRRGIQVVLNCGDTEPSFVHAHLSRTDLSIGQRVRQGDIIGYSGNTGVSSGPHLHFEAVPPGYVLGNATYGRVDPAWYCKGYWSGTPAVPLQPNQRVAGPNNVNQRSAPTTGAPIVRTIPAGTLEVFTGWVRGESVKGIDLWYKDDIGYAWSGGFETQTTDGLADLNPAPLRADQRLTAQVAYMRDAPDKNAKLLQEFPAERVLDLKGYVRGTDPFGDGRALWFVGAYSGGFIWQGAFTDPEPTGLAFLGPSTPDAPKPAPVEPYTFKPDLDFARVAPAALTNVQRSADGLLAFPLQPAKAVCHWWDAPERNPSMAGVVGEFQREGSLKSAHFVVSTEVVQMVSLADRAYHAGSGGNGWVGIEIDPRAVGTDATAKLIQANVRRVLGALRDRYRYQLALTLHKDVPGASTSCSELRLADFDITPAPEPVPPAVDEAAVLRGFTEFLIRQYLESKK